MEGISNRRHRTSWLLSEPETTSTIVDRASFSLQRLTSTFSFKRAYDEGSCGTASRSRPPREEASNNVRSVAMFASHTEYQVFPSRKAPQNLLMSASQRDQKNQVSCDMERGPPLPKHRVDLKDCIRYSVQSSKTNSGYLMGLERGP